MGTGPFPTELHDHTGELIQKKGHEFGATTGRRRRCGWLDLVALKYAVRVNGITSIALMKIDVLTGFDTLKIDILYFGWEEITEFPTSAEDFERVKPVYKSFKGWTKSLDGVRSKARLPRQAQAYIQFIEKFLGIRCDIISTGPSVMRPFGLQVILGFLSNAKNFVGRRSFSQDKITIVFRALGTFCFCIR